uniref:Uncharacterized protein n=1 Tax=Arundo donax TaxID=35708 RepID=A0A0A8Z788_ARUDO
MAGYIMHFWLFWFSRAYVINL